MKRVISLQCLLPATTALCQLIIPSAEYRPMDFRATDTPSSLELQQFCPSLATSSDLSACFQKAIDAARASGRCLYLPPTPVTAGFWKLTSTIIIGTDRTNAHRNQPGVCIKGAGSGGVYGTRGSYFGWSGTIGGTMIDIEGPIEDVRLQGFNLNGLNVAGRLIKAGAIRFSQIRDIFGQGFRGIGFGFYGLQSPQSPAITHSNNLMLDISQVYLTTNQPNAIALDFDGVMFDEKGNSQSNDTWLSTVRNVRLESIGSMGIALRLGFSDNILFEQIHAYVSKRQGGCGVKFDASTSGRRGNSFPTGHLFLKSAIPTTCVEENDQHTIGVNNFLDFGTTDGELIPTHPRLRGITDQGYSFGGFGGPGAWTSVFPSVSAIQGVIRSVAASSSLRYAIHGKTVEMRTTIKITNNGTGSEAIRVALPVRSQSEGNTVCFGREIGKTGKMLQGLVSGSATSVILQNYDGTYPSQDGAVLAFSCTYEAQ